MARHAETRLPLTGKHLEAACEDCHRAPAAGGPRVFQGTPVGCDGCHKDGHDGFFDRRTLGQATDSLGTCALCHRPTGFAEVEGFDHERWTGFAVRGAHAQEGCEGCHRRGPEPDASGRTFGRVAELFGRYEGCGTCHDDPHRGQFDAPGKPREVAGRRDCARCHTENSFRSLEGRFDHALWTGFPLIGAHGKVQCTACHAPLARPDDRGRSLDRAKGRECASCHDNPHGAQFEALGRTDCTRCHAPRASFSDLVFDHDVNSRFALGERHAKVPCASCHKTEQHEGRDMVRYKPVPARCVDCHPTFDDPFQRDRRRQR
ncbi:MAG: cytochrome c3 family protein [Planctomycetota bacterium]